MEQCDGEKLRTLLSVLAANPDFAAAFDVKYDREKIDARLHEHAQSCDLCALFR